jgi:hypothetical protein
MDGTPQPPRLPAPLASMCRDRWWKTYLHASQIGIRPNSVRRDFPCGRALALRVCTLQCVVWMPGRGRFGGKRWTAAARAPDNLVFLRTSISTIKMQSTAKLRRYFLCCSVIVRHAITAFRNRSAAALRNLRDRHGQDRKAAPNRIAPTRLRLQVRRLQPDHVGRAGAAGRNHPAPGGVDGTAVLEHDSTRFKRALVTIDHIQKRYSPTPARVSSWPCRMLKLRPNFS